jgi:hypothetical protein
VKTKTREQLIQDFYSGRVAVVAAGAQPPGAAPVSSGPTPAAAPSTPPPAPAAPATPPPPPVDADGNVANDVICQTPNCGHLASAHGDTDAGDNTGACSMQNCVCTAMEPPQPPDATKIDPEEGAPAAAPAAAATRNAGQLADVVITDPSVVPPTATDDDDGPDVADVVSGVVTDTTGGDSGDQNTGAGMAGGGPGDGSTADVVMGPQFTIPVMVIEGTPTSDGREIAPNALTWRTPPLPLMGLDETSPFGHDGAVICGRLDSIVREGSTISATGFFTPDENGLRFADLVAQQAVKGISVDISDVDTAISVTGLDDIGMPSDVMEILISGEIMGATLCPFPALAEAYIIIGDGTDPNAPQSIPVSQPDAAAAAKGIHVLNVRECEPCKAGAVVASAAGPLAPPAEWFHPVDSQGNPGFDELTPLTVTDDGRVFGHIAPWGVCHIGIQGECVMAPHSSCEYALFHQGRGVFCADGSFVPTGPLTFNGEHASQSGRLSAAQARAHYDNTASRFADVHAGEDAFGVYVSGAVDPGVTDEDVRRFRASGVSGDWRWAGGGHELVAALAVNTPGFPVVTASVHNGQVMAIIAAGAPQMMALAKSLAIDPIEARLTRIERNQRVMAPLAKTALMDRFQRARNR